MREPVFVKICGVTTVEDAIFAAEAGASAIGVNVVPTSKRRVGEATARRIAEAVAGIIEVVLVVADLSVPEMLAVRARTGIEWLQLHGAESPDTLDRVLPRAFKAVGIASASDVEDARSFAGERLLADSKGGAGLGGSGVSFDWRLARELAAERRVLLAGGLTPDNVAEAVRIAKPWGVDVASGVELAPGKKDPEKVRAFIRAARGDGTA